MRALPLAFYKRETTRVARELLGKKLYHRKDGVLTSGIIIETEAYLGVDDPAAHTYQGHRSQRVESMYLDGGHAYVYFIYGIHFCFNVVTRSKNQPEAVLIRQLKACDGIEIMKKRRKLKQSSESHLCSGPGKLCQALAIQREQDGLSLKSKELWIAPHLDFDAISKKIVCAKRVGIDYAGHAKDWPLKYSIDI